MNHQQKSLSSSAVYNSRRINTISTDLNWLELLNWGSYIFALEQFVTLMFKRGWPSMPRLLWGLTDCQSEKISANNFCWKISIGLVLSEGAYDCYSLVNSESMFVKYYSVKMSGIRVGIGRQRNGLQFQRSRMFSTHHRQTDTPKR